MTSRVQNARSSITQNRPPNTRPVGEFYVNFADNQLGVIDPTPAARDLLPVRFHSATASYAINAIVQQAAGLYQAKASIPAHAFNASEWNQFLTNAQGDARWLPLAGGTLTGLLTLSGPPTANLHAATKLYTDTQDALRLPLTGGTLSGGLTVGGLGVAYSRASGNSHAFGWNGSRIQAYVDSILVGNVAIGDFLPLTGGTVSGNLVAPSFTVGPTGGVFWGDANFSVLTMDSSNWQWRYNRVTGQMSYIRGSDGAELFFISPGGNGHFLGGIFTIFDSYCGFQADSASAHCTFANTWSFDWDRFTGDLAWSGGGAARFRWRASDSLSYNPLAPVGGVGAYQNLSDARTKENIQDLDYGMVHLRALRPRRFERAGSGTTEIGFIAQEVQPVVPEATPVMGVPLPDGSGGLNDPSPTLSVTGDALLAVVVNALKSLDQRVSLLEDP